MIPTHLLNLLLGRPWSREYEDLCFDVQADTVLGTDVARRDLALALALVFAVMAVLMTSVSRALLALSPALLTVFALGGVLGLTGLEIQS